MTAGEDSTTAGEDPTTPAEHIEALIAKTPDWRSARFVEVRETILSVDPAIEETWKWMGSPVWERDGILCVGNIFKQKVQLVFLDGAALPDPDGIFNTELTGNKRRGIDFFEADQVPTESLQNLIRAAIEFRQTKKKK